MVKKATAQESQNISPAAPRPIEEVWKEYKNSRSVNLRRQLMEHYQPLVRFTAARIRTRMPRDVELDDLFQAGIFGLMNAIESFDLSRNVKFETYCAPRIRGAILDDLRAIDWVPRLVRARTTKVDHARKGLEMKLGRVPTRQEIAAELGVSLKKYDLIERDTAPASVVSLNRKWSNPNSGQDPKETDFLEDRRLPNPRLDAQKRDLKALITKGLTRAEKIIVVLYYYEELTMKEIGTTLELSESRVSQMHSGILSRLKAQMRDRDYEFQPEPG